MVFLQDFQSYFFTKQKIALKIRYLNRKKSENLFLLHVWRNGKFRRILPKRILRNFPFLQSYFFTKQKIALKILYLNRKKSENLFSLHVWRNGKFRRILPERILRNFPFLQSYFLFCEKIALKILYLNRKKSENLFLLHVWRNGKFRRILLGRILRNFPFLQSYFLRFYFSRLVKI